MTKSDFIEVLTKRLDGHNLPKKGVEAIVDTIFGSMAEAMASDDRVETREAKEGRNPTPRPARNAEVPLKFAETGESVSAPIP